MVYLASRGRQFGRFSLPAVAGFLGNKRTPADLHFWREDMDDWRPIGDLGLPARRAECAMPSKHSSIIILGMHRSGTSCLAGFLQASGVYFGAPDSFMAPATPQNPKGFWERREIRRICDTLLFSAGYDWDRISNFEPAHVRPEVIDQQREAFGRLQQELGTHNVAALKEPRLCLLLPFFADLAADSVVLHVHRHPACVASSLATRNQFPLPYGLALWQAYNLAALQATAGRQVHRVSYEDLVDLPEETTARLSAFLRDAAGIELAPLSPDELREVIDPNLCRERVPAEEGDRWLTGSQSELLAALHSLDATLPACRDSLCSATLHAFEVVHASAALPSQKLCPDPLGRSPGDESISLLDATILADADIDQGEETVVIMPSITEDRAIDTARLLLKQAGMRTRVFVVMDRERQGFVKTFNATAARLSARYIVYLAEDVYPGRDWLKIAVEALNSSSKGLLAVNDSKWRGLIASYGMVRASWARSLYQESVLFTGYMTHAADVELTILAKALGQFVYEPDSVLVEIDPDKIHQRQKVFAMKTHPPDTSLLRVRFDDRFGGLVTPEQLEPLRAEYFPGTAAPPTAAPNPSSAAPSTPTAPSTQT
jgi:hypothetical protein